MRVAVLWLGRVSEDTAGRTYLTELLGPLSREPGLSVDVHLGDPHFDVPAGCRVVQHRVPRRLGSLGRVLAEPLVAARRLRGYDVLLAPFNNVPPGWRGPVVVVQHNVLAFGSRVQQELGRLRGWYRPRALSLSLKRATRILTVSAYLRRLLLEQYPDLDPARVDVVPYGAPAARARPSDKRPAGAPRVLVVSAMWPYKRVDQAIQVFAAATKDAPGARLTVAGPGSPEERAALAALAEREGVGDRVEFLGNVPYAELPNMYRAADVLLYLSEVESFGLPLLEAMAAELPVVAKRIEGLMEIGGDAPTWVNVEDDVATIAAALRRLLTDDDARTQRIRAGSERVATFSWDRTALLTAEALRAAAATATNGAAA